MTDPRTALHERLADDLETFAAFGEIDPVDEAEITVALDEHEDRFDLAGQYEAFGESYVAAGPLFRVLERRGVALRHGERWADADRALDELGEHADLDEKTREQLAAVGEEIARDAPTGYDELLAEYVALTDGLLAGLDWELDGNRRTDETVGIVCKHAGRRFSTELDAREPTVDVDGLVALLNSFVETTDDDRRFVRIRTWISSNVHVFFVDDVDAFENYFSFARKSLRWD